MPTPNPEIAQMLRRAKEQLAAAKAEKAKLFPPNPLPLVQPDRYPKDYAPDQIRQRNALNNQIEDLERRVEELERRLYTK